MSAITRRLSVAELTPKVLEMAQTGVYRESVFEALQPLATKQQIREAIAHAKQFGLHSVANLRDSELGTYYQLDLVKYQSLKHLITATTPTLDAGETLQKLTTTATRLRTMLIVAQSLTIGLLITGVVSGVSGHAQLSFGAFSSALSVGVLWILQKWISGDSNYHKYRQQSVKKK